MLQTFSKIPTERPSTPLLDSVDIPAQLKVLSEEKLPHLANELREFLLYSVGKTGGHFGAGLGVIELTIALHYLYNTPNDQLIWDVGHQAYPHKILTGRRSKMHTLRQKSGIAAFPKREESEYDTFGVGHSSTSISAALGMAIGAEFQQSNKAIVAIIGDGALTAGMAYEALNHAASLKSNMLVILNDNDMSISPNVGGLSNYLARILASKTYNQLREGGKKVFSAIPAAWKLAKRTEEHVKDIISSGTLFEDMGFHYTGPIDGHNLPALLHILKKVKQLKGPQFLHVITTKGKGFLPAEEDPIGYHAINKIESTSPLTKNKAIPLQPTPIKYSTVFGRWLCDIAEQNELVLGITPAMCEGSDLVEFSKKFPTRYFDTAIAEQHAVTMAAGMACSGMKPIVAIYSTFLQRAYDQLIHDVAIQNLDILFAIDRAGMVGEDGPTHSGCYDMAFLRCIPNMLIMAPSDEREMRHMLSTGFFYKGPAAVRYPRGKGLGITLDNNLTPLTIGKGEIRKEGKQIAVLAFGTLLNNALIAAENLDITVVNMRFVKPLDTDLILYLASQHQVLVTLEEGCIIGGAGSGVNQFLQQEDITIPVINKGIPDKYIEAAAHEEQLAACALDIPGIRATLLKLLHNKKSYNMQALSNIADI